MAAQHEKNRHDQEPTVGPRADAKTTEQAVEIPPKATRRRFSAAYKLRILEEADHCDPGDLGALLRREGLYASHLTKWRAQRASGRLEAKMRTPKAQRDAALDRVAQLERENRRLRHGLKRAETVIEAQKKLCALWDLPSAERDEES